jgi:hypothetical protein
MCCFCEKPYLLFCFNCFYLLGTLRICKEVSSGTNSSKVYFTCFNIKHLGYYCVGEI